MNLEQKLKELGIELPESPQPLGSYVPCVKTGNLVFLSGILPLKNGKLQRTGRVGETVSLHEAQEDSKQVVINALSVLQTFLGDLNKIKRCVKINGYVASAQDFTEQPNVLNAASELIAQIFGESGRHARAAIGAYVLPLNASIEIDFIFEIKP